VLDVHGFVDADWVGDLNHGRSTSGYAFKLYGGAITWMSKKQNAVKQSTIEAEYMTTTHASKEVVWLQRLCPDFGFKQQAVGLDCDNQVQFSWQRTMLIT